MQGTGRGWETGDDVWLLLEVEGKVLRCPTSISELDPHYPDTIGVVSDDGSTVFVPNSYVEFRIPAIRRTLAVTRSKTDITVEELAWLRVNFDKLRTAAAKRGDTSSAELYSQIYSRLDGDDVSIEPIQAAVMFQLVNAVCKKLRAVIAAYEKRGEASTGYLEKAKEDLIMLSGLYEKVDGLILTPEDF